MSADAGNALQEAVFAALKAPLQSINVELFDAVPKGTSKDYVLIGDAQGENWGDKGSEGEETILTITAYGDDHRGRKRVNAIRKKVCEVLNHAELVLEGFDLILLHFLDHDTRKSNDGATYESEIRFRALISESDEEE